MARTPSSLKHKIFLAKSIDGTFGALIALILLAGGAYIKEYEEEFESGRFAEEPWFYASSAEYGWPGDEIPAAVIISEEPVPVGQIELR